MLLKNCSDTLLSALFFFFLKSEMIKPSGSVRSLSPTQLVDYNLSRGLEIGYVFKETNSCLLWRKKY